MGKVFIDRDGKTYLYLKEVEGKRGFDYVIDCMI